MKFCSYSPLSRLKTDRDRREFQPKRLQTNGNEKPKTVVLIGVDYSAIVTQKPETSWIKNCLQLCGIMTIAKNLFVIRCLHLVTLIRILSRHFHVIKRKLPNELVQLYLPMHKVTVHQWSQNFKNPAFYSRDGPSNLNDTAIKQFFSSRAVSKHCMHDSS